MAYQAMLNTQQTHKKLSEAHENMNLGIFMLYSAFFKISPFPLILRYFRLVAFFECYILWR